jgi:excisionase family DNA binding protein
MTVEHLEAQTLIRHERHEQMAKLTTQQVAELLGTSRPTVLRLIDAGDLASEGIGNHRQVPLEDALAYRDARRERQYQAIADTSVDVGEDEPADVAAERLARIRKQRIEHRGK